MDGLSWTKTLKGMIWGYPYFKKPPMWFSLIFRVYAILPKGHPPQWSSPAGSPKKRIHDQPHNRIRTMHGTRLRVCFWGHPTDTQQLRNAERVE